MRLFRGSRVRDAGSSRLAQRVQRSESGDTLIEVLLAIVIMGIASVAILLAFATSISGSAEHRTLATQDTVLRTAAEQTIAQMEQASNAQFENCTDQNNLTWDLPSGYSAQVLSVMDWSTTASNFSSVCTVSATNPPSTNSPQLVQLQVTTPANVKLTISFVVDDPQSRPLPSFGLPTHLVFLSSPGTTVAGSTFATSPAVAVEDASGNIVTTDFSQVSLSITSGSGTPGAALSSSCAGKEFKGVVTFSSCSIATMGNNYTLTASDPESNTATNGNALTSAISSIASNPSYPTFNIVAGAPSQLSFSTQPVGSVGEATNFATEPVVSVEDANGNLVTTDTGTVALSIGSYASTNGGSTQGALGCTNATVNAVGGVATFANCQITGGSAAGSYILAAARTGLTASSSSPLTVVAGTAKQLTYISQPNGGANGASFSSQPVVAVEDTWGNVVTTSSAAVNLTITTQPGTGAVLSCSPNPLAASAGYASFAGCQVAGKTGNYTLTAASSGLTSAPSSSFAITVGAPSKLIFTGQPVGGVKEGFNFGTEPIVTVEDSGGNTVTSDTGSVTLAVNTYAAGNGGSSQGAVTCTHTSATAVAGVATFAGCQINGVGGAGSYTLSASRTNLTTGTSGNVSIIAGSAAQVGVTPNPATATASSTTNVTLGLQLQDANGNNVTASSPTTLTLSTPGTSDFFANSPNATGSFTTGKSVSFATGVGTATTYYGDEAAEMPVFTFVNGATSWGSSSPLTVVAGTPVGIAFTDATIDSGTASTVTCTGTPGGSSPYACTLSPTSANGSGKSMTASAVLVDQFGNPTANTYGVNIPITLSASGGSLDVTSLIIAPGAATSSSTFTESLSSGSGAGVVTASVTSTSVQAKITDR
jgi:Tfp pilus assembly protein PilV